MSKFNLVWINRRLLLIFYLFFFFLLVTSWSAEIKTKHYSYFRHHFPCYIKVSIGSSKHVWNPELNLDALLWSCRALCSLPLIILISQSKGQEIPLSVIAKVQSPSGSWPRHTETVLITATESRPTATGQSTPYRLTLSDPSQGSQHPFGDKGDFKHSVFQTELKWRFWSFLFEGLDGRCVRAVCRNKSLAPSPCSVSPVNSPTATE